MNKIKHVSWFFKIVFQILIVLVPLITILAWIKAPEPIYLLGGLIDIDVIPRAYMNLHIQGNFILHAISINEKMLGFLVTLIPVGIDMLILYFLIRLFRLYEEGEVFSIQNVKYIRNIGIVLLVGQLLNPLYEFLMGIILTWNNPEGHLFVAIKLDQTNIGILLMALIIILVSWIMAEGCKLREEQQLTI